MFKHAVIWMVVAIISLFLAPAFVEPSEYQTRLLQEMRMIEDSMGEEASAHIFMLTEKTYASLFEESGIKDWFLGHYQINRSDVDLATDEAGRPMGIVTQVASNYGVSLFMSLYEITFRMVNLSIWLSYSFPFIFAAAWDGLMQRKAKISSFSYTSPSMYNFSWHALIILTFFTFAYFNTPLPVPPAVFPLLVGLFAFFIRNLVSNIQRSA